MATTSQPITFLVPGEVQPVDAGTPRGAAAAPLPAGLTRGQLKQSVRVGAGRGGGGEVRVAAVPGEDVVVLHIAGGPSLTLHPETARDLLMAQGEVKRSRGAQEPDPNEVRVPAQLQWRGLSQGPAARGTTRASLGGVLLSGLDVITGLLKEPAADFVASKVVERFDAQVDAGVYALGPDSLPKLQGTPVVPVRAAPDGGPLLVLVHGTFSDTSGTFGKLWSQHPQRVRTLFDFYKKRVYALDHPTLGKSPIENALTLAAALPDKARLHLVTHSRGGLVAEVLARVCANPDLSAEDFGSFEGAGYKTQRDKLKELAAEVKVRGIKVERIVRVACPARGTLLASKRLDAYLSVFKWTLELAGVPVAAALIDFLGAVAQRRTKPAEIPGLAAQMPDSPLVRWLHAVDEAIPGELRVVAGDIEGDSVVSWLKTLLADAFYWTDNDLVVQTRSMYGGAPRAAGASFVFDQGGKVSHFNYFSNERTAEAIVNALTLDAPPAFRTIGPLSWAGESSTGVRGALRGIDDGKPASEKPAVFVLPGILGSNLKVGGKRIWLGWRLINGLKRLDYTPGQPDGVEPDGPIGMVYDDLEEFLSRTHEVIEFAFDWRRPMEEEARRLGAAVEAALAVRAKSGQPVRFLAHSMGGVLARTMHLECPQVWDRMMSRPGARLLMLGTPNGGSWAPMQVLSGDDSFGNWLVAFGAPFQDQAARNLMASLPGFIQLQAALLDQRQKLPLDQRATWEQLAKDDLQRVREHSWWHSVEIQLNAYAWGVPPQNVLDRAVALRKRLDAQRDKDLDAFKDKLLLVVGKAPFTPDGYEIGDEGLVYLDAQEDGDGRVTLQSALLPGVRTWKLDCEHGSLPDKKEAFEAYLELLQNGTTNLLDRETAAAGTRGAGVPAIVHVRSRPARGRSSSRPPETERAALSLPGRAPRASGTVRGTALRITVVNGDLTFVHQPLLLGHYRSSRLTGTEFVMNKLVGGAMDASLSVGLYPVAAGTHQVFLNTRVEPDNPWRLPRPEAVIVVGLGEEGKLRAADLVHTVRQATIAWAQRAAEKGTLAQFDLAATFIGSGGTGIAVSQSAQLIVQGVREANERLRHSSERLREANERRRKANQPPWDGEWPTVSHLYLIELYLDRASEAWRALQEQATATPGHYVVTDVVQSGAGGLRRPPDSGYRGADYDFISAITGTGEHGDSVIAYTLDTKRARSEVRAQAAQGRLLRELVSQASNDGEGNQQIGRTLFKLLIPVEMEPFLGGSFEMQIELDSGTAGIPWELLDTDTDGSDPRPWAIRAKLLRKLRTADFRTQVRDASADDSILIIGEPHCDPEFYPRLPGARHEARAVFDRLTAVRGFGADSVRALISPDAPTEFGPDARTVINALMERDWRIVHIAGHGEPSEKIGPVPKKPDDPPQKDGDPRGVVLSGDTFLGPREIHNMRVVPELVFVNCCHLAARNPNQLLRQDESLLGRSYDRARFAAGVAEELIKIGVRCVIAAGWAVGDSQANAFATTFYDALLRGRRFIDAVAEARTAAQELGGNTWAAYQCYGDPDWTFRRHTSDAQRPPRSLVEEFAGVASPVGLALALETLAIESKFQHARAEDQHAKIRYLEARFGPQWGGMGGVAEAFGGAYAAARDIGAAIRWYERALAANDGGASIKAAEQLGNLRVRLAWEMAEQAKRAFEGRAGQSAARGAKGARTSQHRKGVTRTPDQGRKELDKVLDTARAEIEASLVLLERLADLQPSIERQSLCGSAWKRMAMLEAIAGHAQKEAAAIAQMMTRYERAETLARDSNHPELFYPALNRMAAEIIVNAAKPGWRGFDTAALAQVRQNLAIRTRDDPDFWSVVALTDLRLYEAIAARKLAGEHMGIEGEYRDLHSRVSAPWMWASVYDQLQFVLPKYAAHAPGMEKDAATQLLKCVKTLAHGEQPTPAPGS